MFKYCNFIEPVVYGVCSVTVIKMSAVKLNILLFKKPHKYKHYDLIILKKSTITLNHVLKYCNKSTYSFVIFCPC